jgi:dTDP-4-dehydro-6-deoxy-alpha-D-gulose 4-ketoreductase
MSHWKDRSVLVTGASGFVGSQLHKRLIDFGADVVGTCYLKPIGGLHQVDLCDKAQVKALFNKRKFNTVIHIAGLDGNSVYKKLNELRILTENTSMCANILNEATASGVEDLMLMSSAEIYFNDKIQRLREEDDYQKGVHPYHNGYLKSKIILELMAMSYNISPHMRIYLPRPTNIYGPAILPQKPSKGVISVMIQSAIENKDIEIWNTGSQTRDFIYIDDCVEMLLKMVESKHTGPCNISSDETIKILELAKLVVKVADSASKLIYKSHESVNLAAFRVLDTQKRSTFYNRTTIGLAEGIERTISYYVRANDSA